MKATATKLLFEKLSLTSTIVSFLCDACSRFFKKNSYILMMISHYEINIFRN